MFNELNITEMKKIFLIGIMSVCTIALFAQNENETGRDGRRRGFNPEQRYERLKKELNLSEQQLDSLKAVEKELFADFRREAQAKEAKMKKRAEEMKQKGEQLETRLNNFLSEEQITKYKELRKNRAPQQKQDGKQKKNME
jgi:Skp family chaperone for outer membrane proteins